MDLPPLPPLQQRILDLARTHKSHDFRPVGGGAQDADGEPRDWDRLAFLGEGVLFSTTSNLLYKVLPRKKSSFLKPYRSRVMSKDSLAAITDVYGWMKQVRCSEGDRPNVERSVDNRAAVTESHIGAIALQYGVQAASEWTEAMLLSFLRKQLIADGADLGKMGGPAEGKRMKEEEQRIPLELGFDKVQLVVEEVRAREEPTMDVDGEPLKESPPQSTFPSPPPSAPSSKLIRMADHQDQMYIKEVPWEIPAPATHLNSMSLRPPIKIEIIPLNDLHWPDTSIAPPAMAPIPPTPTPSEDRTTETDTDASSLFVQSPASSYAQAASQIIPIHQMPTPSTPSQRISHSQITGQPEKPQVLTGSLAKLNEQCTRHFERAEWTFASKGMGQYITWTASLSLQGKGLICEAQGQSKQLAKDTAAREALEKLKWKDKS